ncbi:MAG: hypothetical protein KatS3mg004_1884 [Bryobacteraceae bacterium]|nr:MAG: hypothetical protein KatS3mg004_1884 [Bryobacteraceae bacterium]
MTAAWSATVTATVTATVIATVLGGNQLEKLGTIGMPANPAKRQHLEEK